MANFCTLNPLNKTVNALLKEGNLRCRNNGANDQGAAGNFAIRSGKWYWELSWTAGVEPEFGVMPVNQGHVLPEKTNIGSFDASAACVITNTGGVRTPAWTSSDGTGVGNQNAATGTCAVAIDADSGKMWMRNQDGSWYNNGDPVAGTNPQFTFDSDWLKQTDGLFPFALSGTGAGREWVYNFGQTDWAYTPPSGFLSLSTDNLQQLEISNEDDDGPNNHFRAIKYNGPTTNGPHSITGVGFQPDLVFIKTYTFGNTNWRAVDSLSGVRKHLELNTTTLLTNSNGGGLTSFDSDGFTFGDGSSQVDGTFTFGNRGFVAYCWKANGAGASNDAGTIPSTVSANIAAGFSIIKFTGNNIDSPTQSVGHGLSQAPEFLIFKNTSSNTEQWIVHHKDLSGSGVIDTTKFNLYSSGAAALPNSVQSTTNTVINLKGDDAVNGANGAIICYAFHSVDGFSKVGKYQANNRDGNGAPFVYTGFAPALVIMRSTSDARDWLLYDNARSYPNDGNRLPLQMTANGPYTGSIYGAVDFLSNGFKLRTNGTPNMNANSESYVFVAFADSPFKYSAGR